MLPLIRYLVTEIASLAAIVLFIGTLLLWAAILPELLRFAQ